MDIPFEEESTKSGDSCAPYSTV